METKCCGTCKWNRCVNEDGEWACTNINSEFYTDWTEFSAGCEEWEGR